ncbi:CpsD/CapB family tyrosine-protein kinase [Erysipelothrix urinaevulpis]|uniref:CpsD/CapB family tyrosine-protein kinase n=1 Tax=Erysipelothrix urinaevulpis TaxID=2683717 RepID=UPI0013572A19|nr:CpsD/CapB family tyrosine-protein kinase [Erysipelothrix urinaevulpis]
MIKRFRKPKESNRKTTQVINERSPFPFVEAFNSLRTSLKYVSGSTDSKVFLITSAIPSEGKSTTAINLAITLAKDDNKVLLIDADLRKPSLQRYLKVRPGTMPGLSEVVTKQATIADAIGNYEILNIDLMMSGKRPPNPAELLASPNMPDMINNLRSDYDYIIIDTPPAGVVTDASIMSEFVDGVILVVRQAYSTQQQVLHAKHNLEQVKANILGVVLNNYDLSKNAKAGSATQHYYYYGD